MPFVPDTVPLPEENAALRAANARLREVVEGYEVQLEMLRAEVAALRARLGQDSSNSSRPPSPDGLGRPTPKSLRGKSGRKPGRRGSPARRWR